MTLYSEQKLSVRAVRVFLVIFYAVGIAGFAWPVTHDLFQRLVSLNLLVSFALLFWFHSSWSLRQLAIFWAIAVSGFLLEMAGIHTGLLFGSYSYGKALGLKVLSTPLLIGINWLVLVYCVHILFPGLNSRWFYPLLASGLLVIYDFVMEPVAIATDMWSWQGGIVPLKNYVTWFVVAAIMLYALKFFRISYRNPIASWLLAIQFIFFLVLGFIL